MANQKCWLRAWYPEDAAGHAFADIELLHAERWPEATMAFGEIALAYPLMMLSVSPPQCSTSKAGTCSEAPDHPRPDCFQEMRDQLPYFHNSPFARMAKIGATSRKCLVFSESG
ncbi:MAG: hypothetical protein IPM54_41030 [Polyangiaceae bacterium]|nr:hypothetical protein [Polyangiaceae bacterium]